VLRGDGVSLIDPNATVLYMVGSSGCAHALCPVLSSFSGDSIPLLHSASVLRPYSWAQRLMPVSVGHCVGDVVAIGTLAWNVYKSCKRAPESFGEISSEVHSLHALLKEAEEVLSAQSLPPAKQERLGEVGDGCRCVLEDLDKLVKRYESLGTQSKRTWDRMKFAAENIPALRLRLASNTGLLNGLLTTLTKSVHVF
jgi:hypothetical protein